MSASSQDGRASWLLLVPVLALAIPLLANQYQLYVCNLMLVYAMVGLGFNVLLGNLGQLAFVSTTFFGLGAYATGILMLDLHVPFPIAMLAGGLVSAASGALVSLPALRGVRGFYLAVMTLAFGELMRWAYVHTPSLTRGSTGLAVPLPGFGPVALREDGGKFYLFLLLVTLFVLATSALLRSRTGRAFMAIRENEAAAAAMGIPTARTIIVGFAWSGFVVGIAGGMYAVLVRRVSPDAFDLTELMLHFAIVVVGGLGSIAGSVLGAVLMTAVPQLVRDLPGFETVATALLMVIVLLWLPRGVTSLLERPIPALRQRFGRGRVTALLDLAGVGLRFGGLQALSDVALQVRAGEVVAVIGPNGAGKTSLFNAITGYAGPVQGSIRLNGERIDGRTPHEIAAGGVRRTFQNGGLFNELTVLENVLCGLHAEIGGGVLRTLLRLPDINRRERAASRQALQLLDRMEVAHLAEQRAGDLSGGQQRIVEIVRAIAPTPPLLLLDEPAVGLSPTARIRLAAIIGSLAKEGVGILLIEHAIELVMSVSDRVVVLNGGRKIADGAPDAVRADHQVMEAYLGHG